MGIGDDDERVLQVVQQHFSGIIAATLYLGIPMDQIVRILGYSRDFGIPANLHHKLDGLHNTRRYLTEIRHNVKGR
jgi:hypothetical protein